MRKRKKKKSDKRPLEQEDMHRLNAREQWAAIQLVKELKRSGVDVRSLGIELLGQYYVLMVRRADVIAVDPHSAN